ncbi:MAG: adenylyltransferase/cytidyltransferase family protein [Chthoniobacterales bacterium]|nr:adenylyltransferase/cytidyltransferase family protein [Chthoniobacterales bacterium]
MNGKIVALDELARISETLRAAGKKLVLTNGCFDLLHVGHVRYLAAARTLGDALAVAVNGDASVQALKGRGRPLNRENDRVEVVAALESVDHVVVFAEVCVTGVIEAVRPAVYAKGGDYTADTLDAEERAALGRSGAEIRIIPFEQGYSTTRVIHQMHGA